MNQYIEGVNSITQVIVDEQTLLQMVKDTSITVVPMLIEHYITEARQHTVLMRKAADDNDFATLLHESHTLASSAMALGNIALSELSRKIETSCREEDVKQALELTKHLEELAEQSFQQLNNRKEKGFDPIV